MFMVSLATRKRIRASHARQAVPKAVDDQVVDLGSGAPKDLFQRRDSRAFHGQCCLDPRAGKFDSLRERLQQH